MNEIDQPEPPPIKPASTGFWRRFVSGRSTFHTRFRILGVAIGALVLFKFILIPIKVVGFSMFPTYKPGEVNYINRFAYRSTPPERGDIVSIGTTGRHVTILKRVLGVPGDVVRMRKGDVYVNGEKIEEPYALNGDGLSTKQPVRLGDEEYWVVGDNRMISEFGKINQRLILGKPLF